MAAAALRPLLAAAVGALLVLLVPAGAAASMKTARFHVKVEGAVAVDWRVDHTRYDGCVDADVTSRGAGRERIAFRSERRARMDILRVDGELLVAGPLPGIPVAGTVERDGAITVTGGEGKESHCGGTDNPQEPPAPDCGTRSWRGFAGPVAYAPRDYPAVVVPLMPVLALTGPWRDEGLGFNELYENCPGGDAALGATPNSSLNEDVVFSRKRRIVITGKETETVDEEGFHTTTTTDWRAVLVRRGTKRRPPKTDRRPPKRRVPQCANGRDDDGDGRTDSRDRQCRSPRDRSER